MSKDAYGDWGYFDTYKPVQNHLDDNASLGGTMFETYGNEVDYVRQIAEKEPRRVWTYIDGVNDEPVMVSGFRFSNRIGYVVTEHALAEDWDVCITEGWDVCKFDDGEVVEPPKPVVLTQ